MGNVPRRFFYGPGLDDFDMALQKETRITESKTLQFRVEAFNLFNHAQFFGASSVDGNISSANFGQCDGPVIATKIRDSATYSAPSPRFLEMSAEGRGRAAGARPQVHEAMELRSTLASLRPIIFSASSSRLAPRPP